MAMSLSADIGAAYAIEVNKHLLYTNLSWTIEEANSETTSNTAVGFPSDRMDFISFGNGYKVGSKPTGSESTTRSAGLVLSANYSYDNRYLADLSYRLNGSSQFGADERWGNFWSSARRNSWVMTWRAVAAARRPKSRGVSSYSSPSLGTG